MNETVNDPYGLSDQEMRVLELLAEGHSDNEIATRVGVTPQTLEEHLGSILRKMESRSRTEAAVKAIKRRLFGVGVAGVLAAMIAVNASDTGALNHGGAPENPHFAVECAGHM